MSRLFVLAAFAVCLASAQTTPNDYSNSKSWLCRPGVLHDACDIDLTTTVITADGRLSRETWTADTNAPIDCFYVYPTISTDPTPNSDMIADAAEMNVIRQQFARFGSKCRRYAPLYRQVTLAGLRIMLGRGGGGISLDRGLQYDDVLNAWNYYLEHDNKGRGIVLIAHSQGSFILTRLIREEIDGKPVQARIVSAILPGATIAVPRGKDVGGAFQHVPLCRTASQIGCVIAYSSFRATMPPPANTRFGKVADQNMAAACANPAALSGGSGELHAYLPTDGGMIVGTTPPKPWVSPEQKPDQKPDQKIDTPWVSLPGLLTAQCATNDNATYLEVTLHGDPAGRRTDSIGGDVGGSANPQPDWGLHLVDVNLAMGNLIDIVGSQAKSWLGQRR